MTTRKCIDAAGDVWEVFEVYPGTEGRPAERVPPHFRGGWLCLQSVSERRRLAPIPSGWREWTDQEVLAASERGVRSPRRTPPGLRV